MRDWIGTVAWLVVVAAILYGVFAYLGRKQEMRSLECAASKECTDRKAERKIVRQSYSTSELVRSNLGQIYFRGAACTSSCDGLRDGYLFAEKVGLTNTDGCEHKDEAFSKGCLMYYDELVEAQYDGESTDPR